MNRHIVIAALVACLSVSACAGNSSDSSNQSTPTGPSARAATTATIAFSMSAKCLNPINGVDVYIDNKYVGSLSPGNTFSTAVNVGNHNILVHYKYSNGTTSDTQSTANVPSGGWSAPAPINC